MSSQKQDTNGRTDVVTTVRIPGDQHAALKAIAEQNHRTFVGEVRHLIDQHVKRHAESTSPQPTAWVGDDAYPDGHHGLPAVA